MSKNQLPLFRRGLSFDPTSKTWGPPEAEPRPVAPSFRVGRKAPRVGETLETPVLRMHRYSDSVRVWDLANAGKRGKKVDVLVWYDLDMASFPDKRSTIPKTLDLIADADSFDTAKQAVHGWFSLRQPTTSTRFGNLETQAGRTAYFIKKKERGVDVPAAAERRFEFVTRELDVDVTKQDFSVRDLKDRANLPAIIPPRAKKKTAIASMFRWWEQNEARAKTLTFSQLLRELDQAGVRYHLYMRMD